MKVEAMGAEIYVLDVEHLVPGLAELSVGIRVGPGVLAAVLDHFAHFGSAKSPPLGSANTSSSIWRMPSWPNCSAKGRWV